MSLDTKAGQTVCCRESGASGVLANWSGQLVSVAEVVFDRRGSTVRLL